MALCSSGKVVEGTHTLTWWNIGLQSALLKPQGSGEALVENLRHKELMRLTSAWSGQYAGWCYHCLVC